MTSPEVLRTRAVKIEQLHSDPQNVRTHDVKNIEAIARSLASFGQRKPVVVARANGGALVVIAGNGTMEAAKSLGWTELTVAEVPEDWDADKARAYAIADNRTAELADWDKVGLASALLELDAVGWDLADIGFETIEPNPDPETLDEFDETPPAVVVSKVGDVWQLGPHRIACGDSTDPGTLARLMDGKKARLLHADPPYGMGKQKDGVLNDNIYGAKLDAFQMAWWRACRPHLTDNASAYIWGNAPDLWRLWYVGGLGSSELVELRNEIVWDKKHIPGMASDLLTQYPEASERCLFFQLGDQFIGNINSDDFPEEWEAVRGYLAGEADAAGITAGELMRVCGVGMYSHWFTRSQFTLIPEKHYRTLVETYPGHFARPWADVKREWDAVKSVLTSKLQGARSYFDNGHEIMRDVWEFPRVMGEERNEHATPKPVAMMQRAIKSSTPLGGIVLEPFAGSGSTLIGAESSDRVCYTIELDPRYVDIVCRRYQKATGVLPVLTSTNEPHDFITGAE